MMDMVKEIRCPFVGTCERGSRIAELPTSHGANIDGTHARTAVPAVSRVDIVQKGITYVN